MSKARFEEHTLLGKESRHKSNQLAQRQPMIRNHTLYLPVMKLCQMRRVNSLITEHAIDTKHPRRLKPTRSVRKCIQHLCNRRRGMCPEDKFGRLLFGVRGVFLATQAKS